MCRNMFLRILIWRRTPLENENRAETRCSGAKRLENAFFPSCFANQRFAKQWDCARSARVGAKQESWVNAQSILLLPLLVAGILSAGSCSPVPQIPPHSDPPQSGMNCQTCSYLLTLFFLKSDLQSTNFWSCTGNRTSLLSACRS